jgi:hypothetical protein
VSDLVFARSTRGFEPLRISEGADRPLCVCGDSWGSHYGSLSTEPQPKPCSQCECADYKAATETEWRKK